VTAPERRLQFHAFQVTLEAGAHVQLAASLSPAGRIPNLERSAKRKVRVEMALGLHNSA